MTRTTIAGLASVWLLAAAGSAHGQTVAADREVKLTVGVGRNDRVNRAVSPVRFGGAGIAVGLAYRASGNRLDIDASAHGRAESLEPAAGGSASDERVTSGEIRLSVLPARRARERTVSFGGEADLTGVVVAHRYADPGQRTTTYVLATATVGPLVSIRRNIGGGGGTAEARLSTPLIGIVAHPYSALREGRALETRVATVASLRAATAVVSYTPAATRRFGLVYEYRFAVMRYDAVLPVRALSQSFAIGLVRRSGTAWR
jgi:hypothetical protein